MELKWVEDFVAVIRTGHFARAAELRMITQSALSRRIQSLEQWVGAELVDRSRHPIDLTPAGRDFLGPAQDIISQAYEAQEAAGSSKYASNAEVRINTLHALSMRQVPNLVYLLKQRVGDFDVSIDSSARTLQEDLHGLRSELCDFFISISHSEIEFNIDSDKFPSLEISTERMLAYASDPALFDRFSAGHTERIPLVSLYRNATSSRPLQKMIANAPFAARLHTVYRANLAESLRHAATLGMGVAWLPESIMERHRGDEELAPYRDDYFVDLKIRIFRARANDRPIVNRIWEELQNSCQDDVYPGMRSL